jgi:hypothetical protein
MRLLLPGLALVAGCAIDELDYTGKGCPCPEGWLCRQPENRCARADTAPAFAADWSAAMDALYLFESSALGADASSHGLDLTEQPVIGASAVEPPQGSRAVEIVDGALFSLGPAFRAGGAPGLAFGGWVALSATALDAALVIGRQRPDGSGYALYWTSAGTLRCAVGDVASSSVAEATLAPGAFAHVACRWDADRRAATLSIDGVVFAASEGDEVYALGDADRAFSLSASDGTGVSGRMDEVFFVTEPLSDAAIARIRACGVDGSRCLCDPADAARYAACADADCAALAACNAATP